MIEDRVDTGHRAQSGWPPGRRDTALSLALLGAIVLMALAGLGAIGNWPKVARVGLAFTAYALVLLAASGAFSQAGRNAPVAARYWWFLAAGAAAGAASALARPEFRPVGLLVEPLLAGLLLGPVHWLAVRWWRRLNRRLTGDVW